jgi:hypothetical protein
VTSVGSASDCQLLPPFVVENRTPTGVRTVTPTAQQWDLLGQAIPSIWRYGLVTGRGCLDQLRPPFVVATTSLAEPTAKQSRVLGQAMLSRDPTPLGIA